MKSNGQTLEVEITLAPTKGRQLGRRGNSAETTVPDPPHLPRLARLMALAVKFQEMVDHGEVRDYADLARLGYVTRARITQIMNLLNLAPDIQEDILLATLKGMRERDVRCITGQPLWDEQRKLWPGGGPDAVQRQAPPLCHTRH